MSDLSFRTMLIGVGIFITLATVSTILIYYNVTVSTANQANERTNIQLEYSKRITMLLAQETLTGTDVRNIIRYYYLDKLVEVNITKIKGVDKSSDNLYKNINHTWQLSGTKNISEYNMEFINPSYKGKIIKNEVVGNRKVINIELE